MLVYSLPTYAAPQQPVDSQHLARPRERYARARPWRKQPLRTGAARAHMRRARTRAERCRVQRGGPRVFRCCNNCTRTALVVIIVLHIRYHTEPDFEQGCHSVRAGRFCSKKHHCFTSLVDSLVYRCLKHAGGVTQRRHICSRCRRQNLLTQSQFIRPRLQFIRCTAMKGRLTCLLPSSRARTSQRLVRFGFEETG